MKKCDECDSECVQLRLCEFTDFTQQPSEKKILSLCEKCIKGINAFVEKSKLKKIPQYIVDEKWQSITK